ncbi:hypothetical protein ABPG74_002904 [Tetrahymena malaccensis]
MKNYNRIWISQKENKLLLIHQLLVFLYISHIQCSINLIQKTTIQNFQQFQQVQIGIDQQALGLKLIIEVTFQPQTVNTISQSQFVFLAAEPNVQVPEYYSVLFQQNFSLYKQQNIHLDIEGLATFRKFQSTEIQNVTNSQIGTWNFGLYDIKSDKTTLYIININIYSYDKNDVYCPESCNSSKNSMNTCNQQQQITFQNFCSCANQYLGQSCYFTSPINPVDVDITMNIPPFTWGMRSFNLSEEQSNQYTFALTSPYSNLKMSIVYGSVSQLWVPNILYDSYDIQSSNIQQIDQYPPLTEKIQKMFDPNTLSQIQQQFPYRRKDYDQVITVGFYNYSPSQTATFVFRLKQINSNSSDISGLNQTTMILFIVFGCVIIFCVTPITYFCVKQKKRQEQDFLNQILNNNLQAGQINPNQARIGPISNSQSNQGVNSNQNEILEQLNSPISQLVIRGNEAQHNQNIQGQLNQIIQFQAPMAPIQDIPVDRLKPIKKIVPITKETINRFMPKQIYQDLMRLYPSLKQEGEECTVCLEGFEQTSECRITPCYHLFHSECLEGWFQKHSTCPYCRNSCNRKGIIRFLQQGQSNSYVKRMQQPFLKEKANSNYIKQIKSDGNVQLDDQANDQVIDEFQNPATLSPGRRQHYFQENSPEKPNVIDFRGQQDHINYQNGAENIQQQDQNSAQNHNQNSNSNNNINNNNNNSNQSVHTFSSPNKMQKKTSIIENVLSAINKPLQQIMGFSLNHHNSHNINNSNKKQNNNNNSSSNQKENQESELRKSIKFDQNSFRNMNNEIKNNINFSQKNNNQLLSGNCFSQNAFIDQGNEIFSFISPNLSQIQNNQQHDILLSLNNSVQKKQSFINDQGQQNGALSPENSFQMVSTTRKMFAEQEYQNKLMHFNHQRMNYQDKKYTQNEDFDKPVLGSRQTMNNISCNLNQDKGEDFQIIYDRYNQHSFIGQVRNMFINEADLIDNYGNGDIGNDDDENGTNMMNYKKNKQQIYVLTNRNSVIKKPMGLKSQRSKIEGEDPSNLRQTEQDTSSRANQIPLATRNILNSQPRFFQESNRRESSNIDITQNSEKSKNKQFSENIQNSSVNRTQDEQRFQYKNLKIHSNNYKDEEILNCQQDFATFTANALENNKDDVQQQQQPDEASDKQFKDIKVVNKLIVLDDDDDDDNYIETKSQKQQIPQNNITLNTTNHDEKQNKQNNK